MAKLMARQLSLQPINILFNDFQFAARDVATKEEKIAGGCVLNNFSPLRPSQCLFSLEFIN